MKKLSKILLLMLIIFPLFINAQDKTTEKNYLWDVSANMGSSLLWGDANTNASPFTRWFSKESNFTFGFTLKRKITNAFHLQIALQKGMLSGERSTWGGDKVHPVVNAVTDYYDYHLGLNVDFTSILGFKEDRFMSVYAFGGIGMVHYNAQSFTDANLYNSVNKSTLIVPWGGGLRFRFNERWSVYLESNFRNAFVDDVDAYVGQGSKVNDIYSITGMGVTYRFGQKRAKKPKVEISPVEPADTALAQVEIPEEVIFVSGLPTEAEPNTAYNVTSKLTKGKLTGKAIYEMSIPEDFYISDAKTNSGKLIQDSSSLKIIWEELPTEDIILTYRLSTGGLDKDSYTLPTMFSYNEKGESKTKTFNNRINLKATPIAATNGTKEPNTAQTVADNGKNTNKTNVAANTAKVKQASPKVENAGLEYRIQVATVFGGRTSKRLLQKQLKLQESIQEDPYKNSYRYTVGNFKTYAEAAQYNALSSVRGAYVVVFKNGKYVGGLENTNTDVMDKNGIYPTGETYKVQIAASKGRTYSIAKLAYKYGFKNDQITEDEIAGWYQYTVGKFRTIDEAKALLKEVKLKVPKAYIVKFVDAKRSK